MKSTINVTNEKTEDNKHTFAKGKKSATVIIVACIIPIATIFSNPIVSHAQTATQIPYNKYGVHIQFPGYPTILSEGSDGNNGILITAEFQSEDPALGLDKDGAQMTVDIIPNPSYPIPFNNPPHFDNQNSLQCTEVKKNIVALNQYTNALHISSQCVGFDSDVFMEDLWVAANDKVVHVQYQTLDDYTYRLHARDYIYSVVTLTVDGSVDIGRAAQGSVSNGGQSSSDNSGTSTTGTGSSSEPNSVYTNLSNNGIDPYTANREDLATMQAQTEPDVPSDW